MKIFVTGADGFIGSRLARRLESRGCQVRTGVRRRLPAHGPNAVETGDLAVAPDLDALVRGMDSVVHVAGRAHVLRRDGAVDAAAFRSANVDATVRLATEAARQGVRRFVFISSIGVNGSRTFGHAFQEADPPAPTEPYAASKWEAEQALGRIQSASGFELVVIRPALVYGAGVKGNVLRVLRLVASRWPLPVGELREPRSFIGVENLCDLIGCCLEHGSPLPREVFLAAEPERRSTAEFFRQVAVAMGRPQKIWRWPLPVLQAAALALGKSAELRKLQVPLLVDSSKATRVLGWQPRMAFAEGIAEMVAWFHSRR